jgi:hypothetical protein
LHTSRVIAQTSLIRGNRVELEREGQAWKGNDSREVGEKDRREGRAGQVRDTAKQKEVCLIFTVGRGVK